MTNRLLCCIFVGTKPKNRLPDANKLSTYFNTSPVIFQRDTDQSNRCLLLRTGRQPPGFPAPFPRFVARKAGYFVSSCGRRKSNGVRMTQKRGAHPVLPSCAPRRPVMPATFYNGPTALKNVLSDTVLRLGKDVLLSLSPPFIRARAKGVSLVYCTNISYSFASMPPHRGETLSEERAVPRPTRWPPPVRSRPAGSRVRQSRPVRWPRTVATAPSGSPAN